MTIEKNKDVVRRIIEQGWNGRDGATIARLHDVNVINSGFPPGLTALQQGLAATRTSFPDCHWTIEDLVAEGDKVMARWTARGTHLGELGGIPPTGTSVEVAGVTVFRLVEGKVKEWWRFADDLSMLQQVGALPQFGESIG